MTERMRMERVRKTKKGTKLDNKRGEKGREARRDR